MSRLFRSLPLWFLNHDSKVQVNISLLGLAPIFWSPLFVFQLRLFSLITGIKYHLVALRGIGKNEIKELAPFVTFWDTLMTNRAHWKQSKEDEVVAEQNSAKGLRNLLNNFVFSSGTALAEYLRFCKSYLKDAYCASYELDDQGWFHAILRYCLDVENANNLDFFAHLAKIAEMLMVENVSAEDIAKYHHHKNFLIELLRKAKKAGVKKVGIFMDTGFLSPREDYLPETITKEMRKVANVPLMKDMFSTPGDFARFFDQCLGEELNVALHLQASRVTFLGVSASHPMAFGNLLQWLEFLIFGEDSYLGFMVSPLRIAQKQVHVTLEPDPKWFLGITPLALLFCWLTAWRINLIANS